MLNAVQSNLHGLLEFMRNPALRGTAPLEYCADDNAIGILYGQFVASLTYRRDSLDFIKRSKGFMRNKARGLYLKEYEIKELTTIKPTFERDFPRKTIEHLTVQLAELDHYEQLGQSLSLGASRYHHKWGRKRRRRPELEYHFIYEELLAVKNSI
jgi:hypothetical protein